MSYLSGIGRNRLRHLNKPRSRDAAELVGRTPWSARVPLDPLLAGSKARITAAGRRGRRLRSRGTAPPYAGDAPAAYLSGIGRNRLRHQR